MARVNCRTLGPRDAEILSRVAAGVFDRQVVAERGCAVLAEASHILAVAIDADVVSAVLAVPPELSINEFGVAGCRYREGIGRMRRTFEVARWRGCVEARLASGPGAEPLHRALGGMEEGVRVQFY